MIVKKLQKLITYEGLDELSHFIGGNSMIDEIVTYVSAGQQWGEAVEQEVVRPHRQISLLLQRFAFHFILRSRCLLL